MVEQVPLPGIHKRKESGEAGCPTLQRKILRLDILVVLALIPGPTKDQTYNCKVTLACRLVSEHLRQQSGDLQGPHLGELMPPFCVWQTAFITVPSASRLGGEAMQLPSPSDEQRLLLFSPKPDSCGKDSLAWVSSQPRKY